MNERSLYKSWRAYRLRWKRRYFIARAIRRRRQLAALSIKTRNISQDDILVFSTVKNEIDRLPLFLSYHRKLGVSHFFVVDNESTDGTRELLVEQPDVSVWTTGHSYKAARFGVDWLTWLLFKYGSGHWCLTLDADELFLPPLEEGDGIGSLANWLGKNGHESMRALMLDLYPKGRMDQVRIDREHILESVNWFDPAGYVSQPRPEMHSEIIRGGPRLRKFFQEDPSRAPTMNKVPFVRWSRRFAYLTSTHVILPARLNRDAKDRSQPPTAVLLHIKFMPTLSDKAKDPAYQREHFANSSLYEDYYHQIAQAPDLWCEESVEFQNWQQLEDLGLLRKGAFQAD